MEVKEVNQRGYIPSENPEAQDEQPQEGVMTTKRAWEGDMDQGSHWRRVGEAQNEHRI